MSKCERECKIQMRTRVRKFDAEIRIDSLIAAYEMPQTFVLLLRQLPHPALRCPPKMFGSI